MSPEPSDLPKSIISYESESEWVHSDLDFSYIDALGGDLARILAGGGVAEACYQPGDWTLYRIVIVPLGIVQAGQARVGKSGQVWNRHAVEGMKRAGGDDGGNGEAFYADGAHLITIGERSYPCWLPPGEHAGISSGYIASKFDLPEVSGVTVALLLRSICVHLEPLTPRPFRCPTCNSPSPNFHPAFQHEGEVQPCSNPWHEPLSPEMHALATPRPRIANEEVHPDE